MFDEPLLFHDEGDNQPHEDLSIEEYNNRQANKRKNQILNFGFFAVIAILIFAVILIIIDLIAQSKQLDTSTIEKCLGLLEYIIVAALGFIFGRSKSED